MWDPVGHQLGDKGRVNHDQVIHPLVKGDQVTIKKPPKRLGDLQAAFHRLGKEVHVADLLAPFLGKSRHKKAGVDRVVVADVILAAKLINLNVELGSKAVL